MIADADNNKDQENKNIESFFNEQTDGVIINSVGNNADFIKNTCQMEESKPVVLLDRTYKDAICDSVVNDNEAVTKKMLGELQDQGWQYIVFVSESTDGISTRQLREETVRTYISQSDTINGEILILEDEEKLEISRDH